jgi:hypothetical protein
MAVRVQTGERHVENRSGGQNDRALDQVLQFPDVAWPRIAQRACSCLSEGIVSMVLFMRLANCWTK